MELKILKQKFSIGKLHDVSQADLQNEFCFLLKPTRRIHWSAPRNLCLTT